MLGYVCNFDRHQHMVINHPIFNIIKRHAPSEYGRGNLDKLFLYKHRIHKTYVLAQWMSPTGFIDVHNFGKVINPSNEEFHSMMANMNPSWVGRQKRLYAERLKSADSAQLNSQAAIKQQREDSTLRMATWKNGWDGRH